MDNYPQKVVDELTKILSKFAKKYKIPNDDLYWLLENEAEDRRLNTAAYRQRRRKGEKKC